MNERWSMAAMVSGAAVLLAAGLFAYIKTATQLKFVDLTSGSPNRVRPVPTRLEKFILEVPVGWILVTGIVLLAVGYIGKRGS
jgi:hypothetical protein